MNVTQRDLIHASNIMCAARLSCGDPEDSQSNPCSLKCTKVANKKRNSGTLSFQKLNFDLLKTFHVRRGIK